MVSNNWLLFVRVSFVFLKIWYESKWRHRSIIDKHENGWLGNINNRWLWLLQLIDYYSFKKWVNIEMTLLVKYR